MAVFSEIKNRTYIAAADLRTHQFKFVKRSGAGVDLAGNAEAVTGVLWNNPDDTQAASVVYAGSPTVIAGGTFSAGAALMSNASGQAILRTSTNPIAGYAREDGVAGQLVRIDLNPADQA